jgi:hypothetical protein
MDPILIRKMSNSFEVVVWFGNWKSSQKPKMNQGNFVLQVFTISIGGYPSLNDRRPNFEQEILEIPNSQFTYQKTEGCRKL